MEWMAGAGGTTSGSWRWRMCNEGSTRRLIYIVDDRNNGGRAYGMTLCVNLMKAWPSNVLSTRGTGLMQQRFSQTRKVVLLSQPAITRMGNPLGLTFFSLIDRLLLRC